MRESSASAKPSVRGSIAGDGRRLKIITSDVNGRFQRGRTALFAALIAIWIALPWIHIRGAPALFFDIEARKFFHLRPHVQRTGFVPESFSVVSGIGFGFVYVTALAGRAWCGMDVPADGLPRGGLSAGGTADSRVPGGARAAEARVGVVRRRNIAMHASSFSWRSG